MLSLINDTFKQSLTEEMLQVSQSISTITPLELEILYVIVDLLNQTG